MDFQNREGGKTGSGGLLSEAEVNVARRERLRKLALEAIDLTKDPYFMKNHLGTYECRLCLTLHNNEGSYLAHTQGKKHQANLGRRAAKEAQQNAANNGVPVGVPKVEPPKPVVMKIGRPGYKVIKLHFPSLPPTVTPRYRFMSAFEQRIEQPNKDYQYIVMAAEPYESVAFKIPNRPIDNGDDQLFSYWDLDSRIYTVQVVFRSDD